MMIFRILGVFMLLMFWENSSALSPAEIQAVRVSKLLDGPHTLLRRSVDVVDSGRTRGGLGDVVMGSISERQTQGTDYSYDFEDDVDADDQVPAVMKGRLQVLGSVGKGEPQGKTPTLGRHQGHPGDIANFQDVLQAETADQEKPKLPVVLKHAMHRKTMHQKQHKRRPAMANEQTQETQLSRQEGLQEQQPKQKHTFKVEKVVGAKEVEPTKGGESVARVRSSTVAVPVAVARHQNLKGGHRPASDVDHSGDEGKEDIESESGACCDESGMNCHRCPGPEADYDMWDNLYILPGNETGLGRGYVHLLAFMIFFILGTLLVASCVKEHHVLDPNSEFWETSTKPVKVLGDACVKTGKDMHRAFKQFSG